MVVIGTCDGGSPISRFTRWTWPFQRSLDCAESRLIWLGELLGWPKGLMVFQGCRRVNAKSDRGFEKPFGPGSDPP
jgi:hypothetical protein